MIGGTLDIQSAVDYGTAVILKVPCMESTQRRGDAETER